MRRPHDAELSSRSRTQSPRTGPGRLHCSTQPLRLLGPTHEELALYWSG
jgi:hypothetical protein